MAKVNPSSLYIINQIFVRRLVLKLSARYLSILLEHSAGYVSKIENIKNDNSYPTHEWPKLASILHCQVHDLLPPDKSTSMGELVEKKVLSLSEEDDVKKVISVLKENGFFDKENSANNDEISLLNGDSLETTLERVVKHLNVQDEAQVKVLKKVLNS